MKKCISCRYCILEDNGNSNYTVEGTEADCLLGINPSFPVDSFYGEDAAHLFAEQCERFDEGEPVQIDVDHEYCYGNGETTPVWIAYTDDEEIRELMKKRFE